VCIGSAFLSAILDNTSVGIPSSRDIERLSTMECNRI
jgi:hypothetical protein